MKGEMAVSLPEWIITGLVLFVFLVLAVLILRMQKQLRRIPGRMCSGCPNACAIREKPPACMETEKKEEKARSGVHGEG